LPNLDYENNQELSEEGMKEMERIYAESGGDPVFARGLTSSQKERLINAFLGAEFDYASEAAPYFGEHDEEPAEESESARVEKYKLVLSEGDMRLFYLVSKFGDPRPLAKVLNEFPRMLEANPGVLQSLLYIIKALEAVHQKYEAIAYKPKNEVIPEAAIAYDDLSEAEITAYERAFARKGQEAGAAEEEDEGLPKVALKTYGERRAELIAKIVDRLREIQSQKELDNR
jgi:hypothetical protein